MADVEKKWFFKDINHFQKLYLVLSISLPKWPTLLLINIRPHATKLLDFRQGIFSVLLKTSHESSSVCNARQVVQIIERSIAQSPQDAI